MNMESGWWRWTTLSIISGEAVTSLMRQKKATSPTPTAHRPFRKWYHFGGKYPTLGTNPHSWGFPTCEAVGYPVVLDWATSTIAMGRVQQLKREGKELPANAAIDADGNMTTDPNQVAYSHLAPTRVTASAC